MGAPSNIPIWFTSDVYFEVLYFGNPHAVAYTDGKYDASLGEIVQPGNGFLSSATPLPAALPLFATGLGAMGLLGWRRKRKNAAAIAAA
jgi:hypothetical protein